MDGLERTVQAQGRALLRQCQIGFIGKKRSQRRSVVFFQQGFASATVIANIYVAGFLPLAQQPLDQPFRNTKAPGYLHARLLASVITAQYPLSQIHGNGFHAPDYSSG